MSPLAPFTEAQFQQLAMGKARAYSWEMLAQQIEMPLEIVERVAWTHEKQWNRFLTKAERHIARETIAEVAVVLRKDVRNVEPQLHATLTNSLTRLLQLQQDFSPKSKRRPPLPTPTPTPTPSAAPVPVPLPCPTPPVPSAKPHAGPSLGTTVASLLAFFVLLGALLMGCWNRPHHHERSDFMANVQTTRTVEPGHGETLALPSVTRVVMTPPPWVRESCGNRHDGT